MRPRSEYVLKRLAQIRSNPPEYRPPQRVRNVPNSSRAATVGKLSRRARTAIADRRAYDRAIRTTVNSLDSNRRSDIPFTVIVPPAYREPFSDWIYEYADAKRLKLILMSPFFSISFEPLSVIYDRIDPSEVSVRQKVYWVDTTLRVGIVVRYPWMGRRNVASVCEDGKRAPIPIDVRSLMLRVPASLARR